MDFINLEKGMVNQLLASSDTSEIKMYAKRTKKNFKYALREHLKKTGDRNVNI